MAFSYSFGIAAKASNGLVPVIPQVLPINFTHPGDGVTYNIDLSELIFKKRITGIQGLYYSNPTASSVVFNTTTGQQINVNQYQTYGGPIFWYTDNILGIFYNGGMELSDTLILTNFELKGGFAMGGG